VYHSKAQASLGESGDDDYLVDHSIIMYLMDPNGEFLDFFNSSTDEPAIYNKITQRINAHLKPSSADSSELTFGSFIKSLFIKQ
jgi:cytochrome oxidase Cu insertion factor (SCO1/SenC/PrrC family)